MLVKDQCMRLVNFKLGDGSQIIFLEDIRLGNLPLKQHYPNLYNVIRKKEATVSGFLISVPLNVSFRREINWDETVKMESPSGTYCEY